MDKIYKKRLKIIYEDINVKDPIETHQLIEF